jgi:hypothetical protein
VDAVCDRFEEAWLAGPRPPIEEYLDDLAERVRPDLFGELLRLDLHYRRQQLDAPTEEEYGRRFPEYTDLIRSVFRVAGSSRERPSADAGSSVPSEETGPEPAGPVSTDSPTHLGRYRVTAKLGSGTFAIVYRAYDGDLRRDVAIKVAHRAHTPPGRCPRPGSRHRPGVSVPGTETNRYAQMLTCLAFGEVRFRTPRTPPPRQGRAAVSDAPPPGCRGPRHCPRIP